jgi:hypothetical protein
MTVCRSRKTLKQSKIGVRDASHNSILWAKTLLSDSPAIDAGSNAIAAALELGYDQRGEDFDRIVD